VRELVGEERVSKKNYCRLVLKKVIPTQKGGEGEKRVERARTMALGLGKNGKDAWGVPGGTKTNSKA